jgi:bifunctional DNA-binding transcriptional regulator/antitoxin component of YhaV-PrlF toxin-antitoxin module
VHWAAMGERYRVVFPFNPRSVDELGLKRGDVVIITQKPSSGEWWEGRVGNRQVTMSVHVVTMHVG